MNFSVPTFIALMVCCAALFALAVFGSVPASAALVQPPPILPGTPSTTPTVPFATPSASPTALATPLPQPINVLPPTTKPSYLPFPNLPAVMLDENNDGIGIAQSLTRTRALQARMLWVDATANIDRYNTAEKVAALTIQIKQARLQHDRLRCQADHWIHGLSQQIRAQTDGLGASLEDADAAR